MYSCENWKIVWAICALEDAWSRILLEVKDDPARVLRLLKSRYTLTWKVFGIVVLTHFFSSCTKIEICCIVFIINCPSLFPTWDHWKQCCYPWNSESLSVLVSINLTFYLKSAVADQHSKKVAELAWCHVATAFTVVYSKRSFLGIIFSYSTIWNLVQERKVKALYYKRELIWVSRILLLFLLSQWF